MASPFEQVAEQALSLTARERLRLATELLESVEPHGEGDIERAWEEEIERRIADIDSKRQCNFALLRQPEGRRGRQECRRECEKGSHQSQERGHHHHCAQQ